MRGSYEPPSQSTQKWSFCFTKGMMIETVCCIAILIKVLYLALSYLNTAVSHSHTWKVLKPHAQEIVTEILFPLLCHSDDDEEMWEDDAEEYVRFKYGNFGELI